MAFSGAKRRKNDLSKRRARQPAFERERARDGTITFFFDPRSAFQACAAVAALRSDQEARRVCPQRQTEAEEAEILKLLYTTQTIMRLV
jgi:hypothetical protein